MYNYSLVKIATQLYLGTVALAYFGCQFVFPSALVFLNYVCKLSVAAYMISDLCVDLVVKQKLEVRTITHHTAVAASALYYLHTHNWCVNNTMCVLVFTEFNTVAFYMAMRSYHRRDRARFEWYKKWMLRTVAPLRKWNLYAGMAIVVYGKITSPSLLSWLETVLIILISCVPLLYNETFVRKMNSCTLSSD